MASVAPLLTHLPPPRGFGGLRLDRFSPNFDDARALGFAEVAPFPAYAHVYALPAAALENLAYYFRFGYFDARDPQSYTAALQREIERWRRVARRSDLFSVDLGGRLLVWDFRPVRHAPLAVLEGLDRRLLLGCDAIADAASLARDAAAPGERPLPLEAIERRLEFLVSAGFMLQDGARYLALPIPLGDYAPRAEIVERFDAVVARLGRRIRGGWRIAVAAGELRGGRSDAGRAPRGARPRVSRGQRDLLRPEHFEWLGSGELVVRTRGSRPTFTSTGRSV
jgi:hypothetical protein